MLHQRAAEWYEGTGKLWLATRHFVEARQLDRALALIQARVLIDFLHDPVMPGALDLSMVTPSWLVNSPDQLLAVAADLLIRGDTARSGEYLDALERTQLSSPLEPKLAARFAAMRCFYYVLTGQLTDRGRR